MRVSANTLRNPSSNWQGAKPLLVLLNLGREEIINEITSTEAPEGFSVEAKPSYAEASEGRSGVAGIRTLVQIRKPYTLYMLSFTLGFRGRPAGNKPTTTLSYVVSYL